MDLFSYLIVTMIICSAITLSFFKAKTGVKIVAPNCQANCTNFLKPYPIIGNLHHFVKNRARILEWITELLSASRTGTVTVAPFIFTANPSVIDHTARSHFTSYPKGPAFTTALHDLLGHGIFTSNGNSWRVQRSIASTEFNTRAFRSLVHTTVSRELESRLIPLLTSSAKTGTVIDLQDVLQRFALDNICNVVFNADAGCLAGRGPASEDGERFYCAFEDASRLSIYRWNYPFHWMWRLLRWLNAGSERRLRASIATVHAYVKIFMQSSSPSSLHMKFAESEAQSEESLRGILVNILSAGRDTTPSALTWFFWSVSSAPSVIDRILAEIRSIRSRSGIEGVLPLEYLRELHYLQAALTESMRLHPPVPMMPRECIVDDDVLPDGTKVKKGWTVMYSAYAMGRAKSVWGESWSEFRPERWLEKGVFTPESPFRYPVFHAGPRVCLGKEMAYIQMKLLAAMVIESFEFELVEDQPEHEVTMSLRMVGGLSVRVKEREA